MILSICRSRSLFLAVFRRFAAVIVVDPKSETRKIGDSFSRRGTDGEAPGVPDRVEGAAVAQQGWPISASCKMGLSQKRNPSPTADGMGSARLNPSYGWFLMETR